MAFAIGPTEHEFMQHDATGWLYTSALMEHWSDYALLVLDDGVVVARGMSVPFSMPTDERPSLPDDGWDGVIRWAAEDQLARRPATMVAALEITVDTQRRGSGLSGIALNGLRDHCRAMGFPELVCPVRPTAKSEEPTTPMTDYVTRTRADGLPLDPWLRVHVRAGGEIVGVAPFSMTVTGSLEQWRDWTGITFSEDGEVVVPGGLVPVVVNRRQNLAVYVEPNVWVRHRLPSNA